MGRIIFKKRDLIDKINMSGGFICEAKRAKNGKVEQNMGEIAPQTAPLFNNKSD